jgi:cofilin
MSSGVTVQDDVKTLFEDMKLKKTYGYLILAMTEGLKSVEVQKKGEPGASWEEFVGELEKARANGECRYGIFDFTFEKEGAGSLVKLVFFLWCPDDAKLKQKMVYSSTKQSVTKVLQGINKIIEAHESSDLDKNNIIEELKASSRN